MIKLEDVEEAGVASLWYYKDSKQIIKMKMRTASLVCLESKPVALKHKAVTLTIQLQHSVTHFQ
jgi:hypothetical protein